MPASGRRKTPQRLQSREAFACPEAAARVESLLAAGLKPWRTSTNLQIAPLAWSLGPVARLPYVERSAWTILDRFQIKERRHLIQFVRTSAAECRRRPVRLSLAEIQPEIRCSQRPRL
ncbi:unnamed protein product [Durusdinium trenchii]|uniref:Uncharacterized protein n=1 Tax=Durusdinium trenchii TaxID=1381693 RepID=A0ABP0MU85_9DINO